MHNYTDGNWHEWKGGKCPVGSKVRVKVLMDDCKPCIGFADEFHWGKGDLMVTDFKVIK